MKKKPLKNAQYTLRLPDPLLKECYRYEIDIPGSCIEKLKQEIKKAKAEVK